MRRLAVGCWALLLTSGSPSATLADEPAYAAVEAGRELTFPRDYGSHPAYRTEWWYVTGWLRTTQGDSLGFQITFFRTNPAAAGENSSAFAPHQLLIAHCAISDPRHGRLWQDQRIRRAGMGLSEALEDDAHIWIDDWTLQRKDGVYIATIRGDEVAFDLTLRDTQPLLLNGEAGFSRKGPQANAASYYYSLPHLSVAGRIVRGGRPDAVTGEAWFDHEWSSEYLKGDAVGWDWIGINLSDGGALMAFQIRGASGQPGWSGGTYRSASGDVQVLSSRDVTFRPLRRWKSTRTGTSYPVEWQVRAGPREFTLKPLLDDQENDTRLSTGAIYWEGAVTATANDSQIGRGYLELTGYGERLKLR